MENNIDTTIEKYETIYLDFKKYSIFDFEIKENTKVNVINICSGYNDEEKTLEIKVLKGAKLILNNIDIHTENIKLNIKIEVCDNASVLVNNIILGFNKASTYNIKTINIGQKSKAEVFQKAVVKDGGEVRLNTTGEIKKQALFSENFQENLIYLLDKASMGEASPLLLIDNNEVKAGHKASVSPVNQESIYYLQTRGINKEEAEKLLTHAFIKSLLETMNIDENLKKEIERQLND